MGLVNTTIIANAVAGAIVLASHHVKKMKFHVPPSSPSRSEVMADYMAGFFDPAGAVSFIDGLGSSTEKPGGW